MWHPGPRATWSNDGALAATHITTFATPECAGRAQFRRTARGRAAAEGRERREAQAEQHLARAGEPQRGAKNNITHKQSQSSVSTGSSSNSTAARTSSTNAQPMPLSSRQSTRSALGDAFQVEARELYIHVRKFFLPAFWHAFLPSNRFALLVVIYSPSELRSAAAPGP